MEITCKNCDRAFEPDTDQLKLIDESKQKGMTFIMLKCPNCWLSFPFNALESSTNIPINNQLFWRSPISGSHGHVSFVEDEDGDFFGCGETGAIWRQEKNLFRDIDLIIKMYPHREKCYIKLKNGWAANPNEPENMDELIDKEKIENIGQFERD